MSDFGVRHRDAALESGDASPQSKWRPYPKYKDSGVEWVGEIPEHWEWLRLRNACKRITDGSHHSPPAAIDGRPYVTVSDLVDGRVDVDNAARVSESDFRSLEQNGCRPHTGDVLFSKDGTVGKVALVERDDFVVLSSLAILQPGPSLLSHFLFQFLSSAPGVSQIESKFAGAALRRITLDVIVDLVATIPPVEEQRAIAAFLDRETAKIDALIAKKERLIELLQEKRKALITQAVIKGLDPNVPLKDSGVEWLGKIPAHWDLLPLKRCVLPKADSIKTGPFGSQLLAADMQGEDVKVYNQRTVIDRDFSKGDVFITRRKFQELKSFEIYPGDVLVTTRGTIGQCAIVPADSDQAILHPCLMRIQPDPTQMIREFITLLIQESYLVKTQLALASNATTIDVIYSDTMSQVLVPKPPLHEQDSIVKWIDERTAEIDRLDKTVAEAIDRLKEYRTALISAAVTGKIDVRISN